MENIKFNTCLNNNKCPIPGRRLLVAAAPMIENTRLHIPYAQQIPKGMDLPGIMEPLVLNKSQLNLLISGKHAFSLHMHLPPAKNSRISTSLSSGLHTGFFGVVLHKGLHRVFPFFLQRHLSLQSLVMNTRPRLYCLPSTRQNFSLGTKMK